MVFRTESPFELYVHIIPDYEGFLDALHKPFPTHLRANLLKLAPDALVYKLEARGISLIRVTEKDPSLFLAPGLQSGGNLLEHVLGYMHFQTLTSCLASLALSPGPESYVLDMCASPGGKTSHLAQIMGNRGLIVANEPDSRRQVPLSFNLARLGVTDALITGYQAQEFPLRHGFDCILADVPCSGEGNFRFEGRGTWRGETQRKTKLPDLQKRIILRGYDLLKPGGMMLYSTCTYNPRENEAVVDFLLKNRDAELLPMRGPLPWCPGVTTWEKETYDTRLQRTARFYPHQIDSVGFFMARIGRRG